MPKQTPDAGKRYLVFISHAHADRWIARQLASLIAAKGSRQRVQVFLDEKDIEGGDSIPGTVLKNLQECDELVVLLTPNSISRPWVLIEIGGAWALETRTVAVIDKVSPQDMPDVIAPYKAIDLNDFDDYLRQLMDRVKGANR